MKIEDSAIEEYVRRFLNTSTRESISGVLPYAKVRNLNPEQQLCYALQKLVEHKSETLVLMRLTNVLAEACVAWRKNSPEEYAAWKAKQKSKESAT